MAADAIHARTTTESDAAMCNFAMEATGVGEGVGETDGVEVGGGVVLGCLSLE